MHSPETKTRFIELRAHGATLDAIAEELHVSKPTLLVWQHRHQPQITNLQAAHLEALHQRILPSYETELSRLAAQLNRVEDALATRTFKYTNTEYLFRLAASLRAQIAKLRVPSSFTDPTPPQGAPAPEPVPTPDAQPEPAEPDYHI